MSQNQPNIKADLKQDDPHSPKDSNGRSSSTTGRSLSRARQFGKDLLGFFSFNRQSSTKSANGIAEDSNNTRRITKREQSEQQVCAPAIITQK
jgi:hypothetical protein